MVLAYFIVIAILLVINDPVVKDVSGDPFPQGRKREPIYYYCMLVDLDKGAARPDSETGFNLRKNS
jgi:hypothetical protein